MKPFCYWFIVFTIVILSCKKEDTSNKECRISEFVYSDSSSLKFMYETSNNIIQIDEYSDSLETLTGFARNYYNDQNQLTKIERYSFGNYLKDSLIIERVNNSKTIAKYYTDCKCNHHRFIEEYRYIYYYNANGILESDTIYSMPDFNALNSTKYYFDNASNCTKLIMSSKDNNIWIKSLEATFTFNNIENPLKYTEPKPTLGTHGYYCDPKFTNNNMIESITYEYAGHTHKHTFTYKIKDGLPLVCYMNGEERVKFTYICK